MSNTHPRKRHGWLHGRNRKLIAIVTGTAIAAGGIFGVPALTSSKSYAHMKAYAAHSGDWHGGDHKRLLDLSEAELEARITRVVKHAAIEIDASQPQQENIIALLTAAATELKPVRDRMRATGKDIRDLLLAETIDRTKLEDLRAARLADAERISKSLAGTLADVADVLSPAQRTLLDERIREFRGMHRGRHRG